MIMTVIIYYQMKKSISTISNLKQNKNTNNTNRNKSPQRLVNGVKLYNFSQIDSYKHINKPYLNNVKKEHIKNKLDLEKSTELRVAKRIKRNEMFVSYVGNPFIVTDRHSKSLTAIHMGQDSSLHTNRNIIDEINNLNRTKKINKAVESKFLDEIQFGAHNLSNLFQRQLKNTTPDKIPFNKKKGNKSMISLVPKVKEEKVEIMKMEIEMQFDDILEIKEERYSDKKERELNIFKLLYDKNFFNKNLTLLDKYFFSFNSLFQKFQKYKIQIYRDLSRESRINATKKPEGQLADKFETFSQNELNFSDMINVASGRFTPQIVYQQLHIDRINDNINNSQINEDEVVYREKTFSKSTMAENYNQSIKEIQEFLKLSLTKREQQYQKLIIYRKQEIKKKMEKISKLVSLSIYDKTLHKQLHKQINNQLSIFADQNYRYPNTPHQKDSLVRNNKETKSKNDIIKLTKLIETFQLAKEHDRKVKQLINKRV